VGHVLSGLFLPIFDDLADPATVAQLAAEAEESGWDGVFVWDHVRWREPVIDVADPWITSAAVAVATERIRLGPMVTPLARRRPAKVAKESATLDLLCKGRLTLGVGLGSDAFGNDFTLMGEEADQRRRARMLDESLAILVDAWSGEVVSFCGEFYTIEGVRFMPRPVQRPGVPVWVAASFGKSKPMERAARYEGLFPVNLENPEQLEVMAAEVISLRQASGKDAGGGAYDIVAALPPGTDPRPFSKAGATWWVVEFPWKGTSIDVVRGVIGDGPMR